MSEAKASADRVKAILDTSSWEYTLDEDDPNLFSLDFETRNRDALRVSVIAGDDWVYVSHIFGRNPAENQAAIHRRLLEINWILNGCKFAVDEEGDVVILTELLAEELDDSELIEAVSSVINASEDYTVELGDLGLRA
ncbi:MAG: YbjN domain-containing protein [Chloroflexota bacterium]